MAASQRKWNLTWTKSPIWGVFDFSEGRGEGGEKEEGRGEEAVIIMVPSKEISHFLNGSTPRIDKPPAQIFSPNPPPITPPPIPLFCWLF